MAAVFLAFVLFVLCVLLLIGWLVHSEKTSLWRQDRLLYNVSGDSKNDPVFGKPCQQIYLRGDHQTDFLAATGMKHFDTFMVIFKAELL